MVDLKDIGLALQGFGAGVRGGGSDFTLRQQALAEKRRNDLRALGDERRNALSQDRRTTL